MNVKSIKQKYKTHTHTITQKKKTNAGVFHTDQTFEKRNRRAENYGLINRSVDRRRYYKEWGRQTHIKKKKFTSKQQWTPVNKIHALTGTNPNAAPLS